MKNYIAIPLVYMTCLVFTVAGSFALAQMTSRDINYAGTKDPPPKMKELLPPDYVQLRYDALGYRVVYRMITDKGWTCAEKFIAIEMYVKEHEQHRPK
jgi:hypothetical protein